MSCCLGCLALVRSRGRALLRGASRGPFSTCGPSGSSGLFSQRDRRKEQRERAIRAFCSRARRVCVGFASVGAPRRGRGATTGCVSAKHMHKRTNTSSTADPNRAGPRPFSPRRKKVDGPYACVRATSANTACPPVRAAVHLSLLQPWSGRRVGPRPELLQLRRGPRLLHHPRHGCVSTRRRGQGTIVQGWPGGSTPSRKQGEGGRLPQDACTLSSRAHGTYACTH